MAETDLYAWDYDAEEWVKVEVNASGEFLIEAG